MKIIHNWGDVLRHSYTVWLGYLLVGLNFIDAAFYFVIGYAPMPAWAMGLVSGLVGALIPLARIAVQNKLKAAPTDGGDDAGR